MAAPIPSDAVLLLRPEEAAALLGISRAKLYRLLANGTFGNVTVRVGESTRISRRALESWIARQLGQDDDVLA